MTHLYWIPTLLERAYGYVSPASGSHTRSHRIAPDLQPETLRRTTSQATAKPNRPSLPSIVPIIPHHAIPTKPAQPNSTQPSRPHAKRPATTTDPVPDQILKSTSSRLITRFTTQGRGAGVLDWVPHLTSERGVVVEGLGSASGRVRVGMRARF